MKMEGLFEIKVFLRFIRGNSKWRGKI